MDEFCNLISTINMEYENIMYLGDFNLHLNDMDNDDALQFQDMVEAIGLIQHVNGLTHV